MAAYILATNLRGALQYRQGHASSPKIMPPETHATFLLQLLDSGDFNLSEDTTRKLGGRWIQNGEIKDSTKLFSQNFRRAMQDMLASSQLTYPANPDLPIPIFSLAMLSIDARLVDAYNYLEDPIRSVAHDLSPLRPLDRQRLKLLEEDLTRIYRTAALLHNLFFSIYRLQELYREQEMQPETQPKVQSR